MDRTIGFKIIVDNQAAQNKLTQYGKILRDQDKTLTTLNKSTGKMFKESVAGFKSLERAAIDSGRGIKTAFGSMVGGLDSVNKGIDKVKAKFLNIKTILTTGVVGALGVGALTKLYNAGNARNAVNGRVGREFGADAESIKRIARAAGSKAGVGEDEMLKALIPSAEAIQATTQSGQMYRGKKLTESSAKALRERNMSTAAELLSRAATISPDADVGELGQALAAAGTGPEGMRRLASTLGLNKARVAEITKANAKGNLAQFLGPEKAKAMGVGKGVAGQGTIIDVLFQEAGITKGAAEAAQSKFGFQIKSIGSQLENVLGEVGGNAMSKLNEHFKKGTTLAQSLKNYLASPAGKNMIDKVSAGVAKVVEGIVFLAKKIPEVINFVSSHKGLLGGLVGGFAALRVGGAVSGLFGGGSLGAKALGAAGIGGGGIIPVRVMNWGEGGAGSGASGGGGGALGKVGAVIGAATAGYAIGTAIDEASGALSKDGRTISDRLSGTNKGGAGYLDDDNSPEARAKRELQTAKTIARRVESGSLSSLEATKQMQSFARTTEGSNGMVSPLAQGMMSALSNGKGGLDWIKNMSEDKVGSFAKSGGNVNVTIGSVHGLANDATSFVNGLMPQIKEAMIRAFSKDSAGGAAPNGPRK